MRQYSLFFNFFSYAEKLLRFLCFCFIPFTLAHSGTLAIVNSATEKELNDIPPPQSTTILPKVLTLQEAIILALRNNPIVHSSRFQRINDKYALELANYAFEPHFDVSGSANFTQGEKTGYNFDPAISLTTPIGTQISVQHTSDFEGNQQEQLTVTQPILRGFGAINRIPWLNARDNEQVSRQNFKSSITDIVTQVITNYRKLVEDLNNVKVQRQTLKREEETKKQYELRIKAGKMARSELLQEQTTLATIRLEELQQQSSAEQDYQLLLDTLGLTPQSRLNIATKIDFKDYHPPGEAQAIQMALDHNPQFVIQQLQFNAARRSVEAAKDDLRWQLDVIGQTSFENSSGSVPIINNNTLVTNDEPSITLQLSIPIRDIGKRASLVNSKVALIQAEDALEQSKRSLIRDVLNGLTNLHNQQQQLLIAEQGLDLQRQNLVAEQIKQRYGQATALNVSIIQGQLLQQQIDFVGNQISYLNNVTAFETLLGSTLDHWDVELRY